MSLNLNLAPILQDFKILLVGSVDGLLCLWHSGRNIDNTYICNPITREFMILPRQQYYIENYREAYASIVYCFGVGSLTKEYKVIRVFQGDIPLNSTSTSRPSIMEAEVYTLGTGQWRSLGRVPYGLGRFSGPFLKGHAHWTVIYDDTPEKLCVFDFDKETFKLFPSPPVEIIQENCVSYRRLAVLKGCLCQSNAFYPQFTIWVMKEYGVKSSWHKEVVIKKGISPERCWTDWALVHLIERLKDGTILILYYKDALWAYSSQTRTIEDTTIFDGCFSGVAYRPSFLKLQNFGSERVHVL